MRDAAHYKKDEYYKDRSALFEGDSAVTQHKSTKSYIKDYSMKHKVTLEWDISQDAMDDRICVLTVDDYKVVVDWEEILRAGRFC